MRQLFNQLMGKKPTMLTPSQMAMQELISGAQEAQAERAAQPVAPPDTSGLINTINQRGGGTASADVFDIGGQTAPSGALGGDIGGMGSMMSGALGGLSGGIDGVMADAQKNVDLRIKDNLDPRNPMRENTLARVRSGQAVPMRGLRYGGYVAPGEEVLVGEVAPEKVIARPEGGVEVVPLDAPQAMADDPFTAQERGMMDAPRMSNPERSIGAYDGVGYGTPAYGGDGSQRPVGTEAASGISDITIDEGSAPPPRRSLLDTKRIIARNNDGLTDEGVWQAREDVLKEDQWRALNEPVKKSKWKDIGMMLLTSLNNQVNNRQDPVRTWGEIKRDEKVGALAPQLQVLQQRRAEKDAQAKIELDRKVTERKLKDYDQDEAYRRDTLKQGALKQLVSLKHFDPNNPVHVERAKQAGLDTASLQGWDDRNPFVKKIGGREYQWDGTAFKPIDVPDNELVEYNVEVLNPNGTKEIKTYKVPKADAVKFSTQLNVLGLQNEQRTREYNTTKTLETEKTNVANVLSHQNSVRQTMTQIANANANIIQGNAKAQAANARVQAANAAAQAAQQAGNGEAFTAAQDEFNKASAELAAALGEVQGGDVVAKQLQELITQAPPRITFTPIEAVRTGTGKPVPKAKDPLGLFR